jgi:hypothetical protein
VFLEGFRKLPPVVRDPLKRLYWRLMFHGVRILPPVVRDPLTRLYRRVAFQGDGRVEFVLEQAIRWLSALRESGVKFGFPEDLTGEHDAAAPLAILKHDIHHNLDRAVAMAQAEQEKGIAGIYFMMGPHYLNKDFFGSSRSWEQLRTIQGLGHRIGLHLDVIDAILRRGDLYAEIADVLALFSVEGLAVEYGNSHGNTGFKAFDVRARDFFTETAGDVRVPEGAGSSGNRISEHLRRYSLKHIGEQFGLRYWVDNRVLRDGVSVSPFLYVTDNAGAVRIPARNMSSRKFEIDKAFVAASVSALAHTRSLILLHPQWYAATPKQAPAKVLAGADVAPVSPNEHFNPNVFADIRSLDLNADRDILDLSILKDGFRYECRLNRRRTADHLIVALHGGVAGAKALPVLPRWTQHTYFRAPILSVFDPLIYEHPHIPAGWYVGDLARDATIGIADIVRTIAGQMNIGADRIVFIGGSSGGFASVRLACALDGAKFVSLNGQTRIVDYYPSGYKPFSAAFDPAHAPRENAALHESRWSTPPALEQALHSGAPVRGVVIQNVNDKFHFEKHYTPFCARFGLALEGGYSADRRLRSVPYEGERKHGAEPADIARRIVKELIPELLE